MSSWQCPECRTVHPDGIPACPNHEETSVAKVGANGATQYVAEGDPVPDDLPAEVRLVGPGAPDAGPAEPAPERVTVRTSGGKVRVRSGTGG